MADSVPISTSRPHELAEDDDVAGRRRIGETLAIDRRAQLLELAVVFSPAVMAIAAFRVIRPDNPLLFMGGIWLANVMMLCLVLVGIRLRGESCHSIGLRIGRVRPDEVFRAMLKSIPVAVAGLAAFAFGSVLMVNVVGRPEAADLSNFNDLQGNLSLLLLSLACVYVVSSFGEEVVYRGFLITRLAALFGGNRRRATFGALATSSAIFGLAHFEWGAMGVVQTTCMGLAFGVCFLKTQTLWPLILAHAWMDTLLLVPLYFAE